MPEKEDSKKSIETQKSSLLDDLLSPLDNLSKRRKLDLRQSLTALLMIVFFVGYILIIISISANRLQSSWYAFYFVTNGTISTTGIVMICLDIIRWVGVIIISLSAIFWLLFTFLPENDSTNRLFYNIIRGVNASLFALPITIGLYNLVLYSVIGWAYLDVARLIERAALLLCFLSLVTLILGVRFRLRTKVTHILEFSFNVAIALIPVLGIISLSMGESAFYPPSFVIPFILLQLLVLLIGIDEIRVTSTWYMDMVTYFLELQKSTWAKSTVNTKRIAVLAQALTAFGQLTPDEQNQMSQWILENTKPTFARRFWSIVKIVLSTAALAMLVEEPASILLKWALKTLFNYSY